MKKTIFAMVMTAILSFSANAKKLDDLETSGTWSRTHIEVCEISIDDTDAEFVFSDETVTDFIPAIITSKNNGDNDRIMMEQVSSKGAGILAVLSGNSDKVETYIENGSFKFGRNDPTVVGSGSELWLKGTDLSSTNSRFGSGNVTVNYKVSCIK